MKTMRLHLLASFLLASTLLFSQNTNIQQPTSVNADGAPPDASAILDVQATDRGMLTPRMTTAQRAAIAAPATGLLVYDTDTGSFWYHENNNWNEIPTASLPSEGGVNPTGTVIPDNNPTGAVSTITLFGTDTVAASTQFQVCFDITHAWTGDLNISLEAPDGTSIDLSSNNVNSNQGAYAGSCFTSEATNPIESGENPFFGNWQPEEPFSAFLGKTIGGDWKLRVVDDSDAIDNTDGVLNFWSLKIAQSIAVTTILSDDDKDTWVTVEHLPDEDIVRIEAGGNPRVKIYPDSIKITEGSFISGSNSNTGTGVLSFVGGGIDNHASGRYSFIGGGDGNTASNIFSFVGGGANNAASSNSAFVAGGQGNTASGTAAIVGGGGNTATGGTSAALGGNFHLASGQFSFVGGGLRDTTSSSCSFIGGGSRNKTSGECSFIGGGTSLTAKSTAEAVFGTYNTDYTPNSTDAINANDRLFVIGNGIDDANRSNAVTVLKSGDVGIGTAAPLSNLHVATDGENVSLFENTQALAADVANALYFKTGTGDFQYTGGIKTIGTGSNVARLGLFTFASATPGGLNERVSILDNGNVGIGLDNPTERLHVNGDCQVDGQARINGEARIDGQVGLNELYSNVTSTIQGRSGDARYFLVEDPLGDNLLEVNDDGNVNVVNNLSKGAGSFKIDHPLDPENKYLYHSFVESPDMMNVYNGNVTTDANGFVTVELPAYFEALNKDFRYQLTVIGTFAQAIIKEEVSGNQFIIQTNEPNVKVSWQVTGIRHDPYANMNRIEEEVEKKPAEQGFYLHPAAYGQPQSKSIGRKSEKKATPKMTDKKDLKKGR